MSEMDLEYELEIEAELERERHEPMPPEDTDQDNVEPEGVSQVVQASITTYLPHDPIKGLMQRMRAWDAIEIENRTNSNFHAPHRLHCHRWPYRVHSEAQNTDLFR